MRIEHSFDDDATSDELSDEFCEHDSEHLADTINEIGSQFKIKSYKVESKKDFDNLDAMLEDLWNATESEVEDADR